MDAVPPWGRKKRLAQGRRKGDRRGGGDVGARQWVVGLPGPRELRRGRRAAGGADTCLVQPPTLRQAASVVARPVGAGPRPLPPTPDPCLGLNRSQALTLECEIELFKGGRDGVARQCPLCEAVMRTALCLLVFFSKTHNAH